MQPIAILLTSANSYALAQTIRKELPEVTIYSKNELDGCVRIHSFDECIGNCFRQQTPLLFIGAMGICVRSIAPWLADKHTDPAVVCIDSTGRFIIPVVSGHIGGANELAKRVARILGGEAVITTQSDRTNLWALDTLDREFNWTLNSNSANLNQQVSLFVSGKPTALLLDIRDKGTAWLEKSCPSHVTIYYSYTAIDFSRYQLFIAVTPFIYRNIPIPAVIYHPPVLQLGVGCRKDCDPAGVYEHIRWELIRKEVAPLSVAGISTIDIKQEEALVKMLTEAFPKASLSIYTAGELADIPVPNPSEKVKEVTTIPGVAEASAIRSAGKGKLIIEKQKGCIRKGNEFTFAVALNKNAIRQQGHIEIVGAGPGDPELVSVRGKNFLEQADLILYAGSLVPEELTYYAKPGAIVRSSAAMALEEQLEIMKEFYDRGCLIVRLHTGDPCIYGAIQEQMAFFDQHGMSYHITPGISSFQAAAAALRSQFTIPEKVQTIILTRGEGRTPMPEKEKLSLLARSQSTMCIFLSASVVDEVQKDLLEHYPPTTPVAVCYKLTWKDERIYCGELKELAQLVKENQLTLTTMIVVGEAINNRQGLSRLYSAGFAHLFRK